MIPVDDTSSPPGQNGTILMAADWIALAPGTSAPTTTGTQTALAIPAGTGDLIEYLNNATLLTIQGIVAGLPGQRLTLISKGAGQVDLAHLHASGTALGQLKLFATTGLTSLAAGSGTADLQYDATVTQWRLVSHEQGAWITPTFAAGDYTATAGTWTLAAGDVITNAYRLSGRTLTWNFRLASTSVSNAGVVLKALLFGFVVAKTTYHWTRSIDNGAAIAVGFGNFPVTSTMAEFTSTTAGAGYAIATNTTEISGLLTFEVQ